MIRIIKEKETLGKKPQALFFENVKNLQTHDKGNTFKVILETLQELGYHVRYKVLNAKDYGNIPQNRERIYIVAFLDKEAFDKFSFDVISPIDRTIKIKDLIDSAKLSSHLYYDERFKHYEVLKSMMTNPNTVYQWRRNYVRANKNEVCPTLTANMGTGGHNVPLILTAHGIRKLTPRECFSFQGFPGDFKLPTLANSRLYKQVGNSVAVPVVQRIAEQIRKALN